jgi:hypothetical protein
METTFLFSHFVAGPPNPSSVMATFTPCSNFSYNLLIANVRLSLDPRTLLILTREEHAPSQAQWLEKLTSPISASRNQWHASFPD